MTKKSIVIIKEKQIYHRKSKFYFDVHDPFKKREKTNFFFFIDYIELRSVTDV